MIYENMSVQGKLKVDKVTARPPKGPASNRPSNPVSGSLYLETSNEYTSYLMVYTGVSNIEDGWERVAAQQNMTTNFKYRQIINYSYIAGGYKNSSPWKNVHKATNSTDQTYHIGELLDYPANYTSGACNLRIFFMWSVNTDGAHKGPTTIHSTTTSAVNMFTDTNYAHQSQHDIQYTRSDCGTIHKEHEFAWIFGGNRTEVDKFNLSNETRILNYGVTSVSSGGGVSAFSDENAGYVSADGGNIKMNFITETITTGTSQWAAHGQQKGISSKVSKGYAGNEGSYNGGYNLRRWDLTTDTNVGNIAKIQGNTGEENFTMGQDHQYMLGNYNGAQNNDTWKLYYYTDTGIFNPIGLQPAVNGGTSSGHCGWRE